MRPYRFGRLMKLSKANGRVITNTGGSFLVQDRLDVIGRGVRECGGYDVLVTSVGCSQL